MVESIPSIDFKVTRQRLKKIFTTYGTSSQILTDNGPPFNSRDFEQFADDEGFVHHSITALHPRANGEAEAFMRLVNKIEQISALQGLDALEKDISIKAEIVNFLQIYSTQSHWNRTLQINAEQRDQN